MTDYSGNMDAAEGRVAALARTHGLPIPKLMDDDGAPHDEVLAFSSKTGASLDYIFLNAHPRYRPDYCEPSEIAIINLANLVAAFKVVANDFKELGNDDPIGRDRRDAVIGLAEAMAAVIDGGPGARTGT